MKYETWGVADSIYRKSKGFVKSFDGLQLRLDFDHCFFLTTRLKKIKSKEIILPQNRHFLHYYVNVHFQGKDW